MTLFKAKLETTRAFLRWLGVFAAGVLLTAIIVGFTVAHSAGRIEATLDQQAKQIQKLEANAQEQSKRILEISVKLTEIHTLLKNRATTPD